MYDSSALGKMWNVFKSARLCRKLLYLLLSQDSPEICLCCSNFCLKMVSKYFTPAHPFLWMLKPIHTQVQHQCCGLAVPLGCRNRDNDRGKAKIRGLAAMTAPWPSACCSQSFKNSHVFASVVSLSADASCTLLPSLICSLPVHAGRFCIGIILGMEESTGHCMHARKWSF